MWPKSYRDYKENDPLVKEQVRSSKGIIGCEMHEMNGWGETILPRKSQKPTRKRQDGFFAWLKKRFFGKKGRGFKA